MHFLQNSKLIVKIALPFTLIIGISVGLVAYARSTMHDMAAQTATIADVNAADRRAHAYAGRDYGSRRHGPQRPAGAERGEEGEFPGQTASRDDRSAGRRRNLISLADTPDRRTSNLAAQQSMEAFFSILDQSGQCLGFGPRDLTGGEGRPHRFSHGWQRSTRRILRLSADRVGIDVHPRTLTGRDPGSRQADPVDGNRFRLDSRGRSWLVRGSDTRLTAPQVFSGLFLAGKGLLAFQGLSRGDGLLIRLTTRRREPSRDRSCRPGRWLSQRCRTDRAA